MGLPAWFIAIILTLFFAVIAGSLYVVFILVSIALRLLLGRNPDAHPAKALLLASAVLAAIWIVVVNLRDETGWLIFWPLGLIGTLALLINAVRRLIKRKKNSPVPPGINLAKFQWWVQDLTIIALAAGVAFIIAPRYAPHFTMSFSEHPAEIAGYVAFWPAGLVPDRWHESVWWAPYVFVMQGSALAVSLDVARRSKLLQEPGRRAGYVALLQGLVMFFGCLPLYGWLIWRYNARQLRSDAAAQTENV